MPRYIQYMNDVLLTFHTVHLNKPAYYECKKSDSLAMHVANKNYGHDQNERALAT